ncbi:divalent-cation tolerance protein CutA [Candidatus Woesearchaeota archaeon CG10_big_fil_rev_8_21_14_0_10_45_5]|nr:MAG: divalent-cation tolerance protein CutA [Candidatus Woesearchaeota archaeon CG10_big_fil_rev_8_21_14_0_10_45_5]PIU30232.1 MAG: divalent-cation tolerance protein CutA [Candidatus Woesearchaeota archaeon CG07_land_8_20_14_0_80_44_23]
MAFIIVYVTHENLGNAQRMAAHLLKKRLIACANFFPIKSSYWWKGKIENSQEIVSLLKTRKENWEKVKSEIKKIHSYKTPCIIKIGAEANKDYESWINKETKHFQ